MLWLSALAVLQLQDTSAVASTARPELRHRDGRIPPAVTAAYSPEAPAVDGSLDDPVWRLAQPVTGFRRDVPSDGRPASDRTVVRLLYDRNALYIGARLYSRPRDVSERLSRRDSFGVINDAFFVLIDSYHDHRTAFVFGVTPAGERRDMTSSSDGSSRDESWDPVWEAKTQVDSLGWTAEMRIPFSQLRFPPGRAQVWGIQFRRDIRHSGEAVDWAWTPRTEPGQASKFGHLLGLRNIPAPRHLEVLPYTVSQARFTQNADPRSPFDDGSVASLSGGLDLKYGLTSDLTLDATINPDFGQVEADPSVVNLSAFETRFDERRPFFVEGSGIMDFGVRDGGVNFYYSRRIGRAPQHSASDLATYVDQPTATSILGAAKLSGRTRSGWSIGAVGALTGQEFARLANADGTPLPRVAVEPRTGYGVFRLRRDLRNGGSGVGLLATVVERDLSNPAFRDLRSGGLTGGVDFFHRFAQNGYEIRGGVGFATVTGDTAAIDALQLASTRYYQRPDQSYLRYDPTRTRLTGLAGELNVSKISGDWLFSLNNNFVTPGLELNDVGFQTDADRASVFARVSRRWVRPGPIFRNFDVSLNSFHRFNFGGTNLRRTIEASGGGQLRNFWGVHVNVQRAFAASDDRATRGGPLLRAPGSWEVGSYLRSDGRRAVSGGFGARYDRGDDGRWSVRVGPDLVFRSNGAVSLSLSPSFRRSHETAFYVTQSADPTATATLGGRYLFAQLDQNTLSLTTRLNVVLTPSLSVQLYAQPFVATGDYQGFKELTAPGSFAFRPYGTGSSTLTHDGADETYTADPDGAGPAPPITFGNPDFRIRSIRSNLVLRWEYLPGSTLFLVWNHSRSYSDLDPRFDALTDFGRIWGDPQQNVLLVKADYYLSL
jgi:Domain of unknown function (DUF5916)